MLLTQRYAYRMAETMPFSLAWLYVVFPLSFFLMALFSIEEIIKLFAAPEEIARIQKDYIDDVDMLLEEETKKKRETAAAEEE